MSAITTLPTEAQIKAYADQLPVIYRLALACFQSAAPNRLYGEGVLTGTLYQVFRDQIPSEDELVLALGRLEEAGFLRFEDLTGMYYPTAVGEELLHAVTGRRAKRVTVPELPKPTW